MIFSADIATTTGWAFGIPGHTHPLFGEYRMASAIASEAHVFDNFETWLDDKMAMLTPRYAFIEDVFMPKSTFVAARLYGLRAIAKMTFHRHSVRVRIVPTQTVQRFMTGQGRWPKGQKKAATMRACERLGWHPTSDNEGDALALWLYGEHEIAPRAAAERSAGPLWSKAS